MEKPPADEYRGPNEGRLDSWKKIAVYLKRDVTTVQRWEKREGMPVHRQLHDRAGSIYAFRSELDAWVHARTSAPPRGGWTTKTEARRTATLPHRRILPCQRLFQPSPPLESPGSSGCPLPSRPPSPS